VAALAAAEGGGAGGEACAFLGLALSGLLDSEAARAADESIRAAMGADAPARLRALAPL
jgi:hypothetical protein